MNYQTKKNTEKQHALRKAARKTTPYKDGLGKLRKVARDSSQVG